MNSNLINKKIIYVSNTILIGNNRIRTNIKKICNLTHSLYAILPYTIS